LTVNHDLVATSPITQAIRRTGAVASLLAGSALLSGCFLQPGTFDSTLNLRQDGRFSFDYDGEIVMAGLGDLADMAQQANASGPPDPCIDDATGKERACSDNELAQREAEEAQSRAMMQAMLGGADMSDPQSAQQLAQSLARQKGWDSVEYAGEGVFEVSFSIQSVMAHDFDFPTMEGMPVSTAFVTARLRDEGRVRIEAPGFAAQGGNPLGPMMGMFGAMSAANGSSDAAEGDTAQTPPVRPIEGTFRIVTDARILANNTDEGPQAVADGEMLVWAIDTQTAAAPMALVQLTQ